MTATSIEALRHHEATGALKSHLALVVATVRQHPGKTASELAEMVGLDAVEIRRRCTDGSKAGLLLHGQPRRPAGKKLREITWHPVETQGALW